MNPVPLKSSESFRKPAWQVVLPLLSRESTVPKGAVRRLQATPTIVTPAYHKVKYIFWRGPLYDVLIQVNLEKRDLRSLADEDAE